MTLFPKDIQSWVKALLTASQMEAASAAAAADIFVRASLRGLGHHDLSYLPQRLGWLASGQVNPVPRMECVSGAPAAEVWDGDGALGEVLCSHITHRALELARNSGVGYASVRRSNHFLAAEPYTQIGAEAGFLVMVWSNTDAGMAFPGQSRRQIGNNPLGWGLGQGESALSADLCMAYSSLGNLTSMAAEGRSTPPHWGHGPHGELTDQPQALLEGAVGPIGGHKGLALALLGEVLTGVLSDGATLDQVAPGGGLRTHCQMVMAFDLAQFGGRDEVEARVKSLKERARLVSGIKRLPGDRSHTAETKARADGIVIADSVEASLREWSAKLGVAVPSKS